MDGLDPNETFDDQKLSDLLQPSSNSIDIQVTDKDFQFKGLKILRLVNSGRTGSIPVPSTK